MWLKRVETQSFTALFGWKSVSHLTGCGLESWSTSVQPGQRLNRAGKLRTRIQFWDIRFKSNERSLLCLTLIIHTLFVPCSLLLCRNLLLSLPAVHQQAPLPPHLRSLLALHRWRSHLQHLSCADPRSLRTAGPAGGRCCIGAELWWMEHLQAAAAAAACPVCRALPAPGALSILHLSLRGAHPLPAPAGRAPGPYPLPPQGLHPLVAVCRGAAAASVPPEAAAGRLPEGRGADQLPGAGLGQLDRAPQGGDLLLLPGELLRWGHAGHQTLLLPGARQHEVPADHHHVWRRILLQAWDPAQHHPRGVHLLLNTTAPLVWSDVLRFSISNKESLWKLSKQNGNKV